MEHLDILAHILNKPEEVINFIFLEELLKNEDYIIYFYMKEMYSEGVVLNETTLEMNLKTNMRTWVNKKSKLFKLNKLDIEAIKTRSETLIISDEVNLGKLLYKVTMERFREIKRRADELAKTPIALDTIKEYALSELGDILARDVVTVMREGKTIGRNLYTKKDMLEFVMLRSSELNSMVSIEEDDATYAQSKMNIFKKAAVARGHCFTWNLGENVYMPPVEKGMIISLMAPEKMGKTKFSVGEIAYNTIRSGNNVNICSGEMSEHIILSFLITKHIYAENGYKIDSLDIQNFLMIHSTIQELEIDISDYFKEKEIRNRIMNGQEVFEEEHVLSDDNYLKLINMHEKVVAYTKMDDLEKEVILAAFSDLIDSTKYGRVHVYGIDDGVFNVDTMQQVITSLNKKHETSLFIMDHAGFAYSNKGLGKTEVMTRAYQIAKAIAEYEDNPVVSVVINHVDTVTNTAIKKGNEDAIAGARAHGTSEGNKSADLEIFIYQLPEDKREEIGRIRVTVSRHYKLPESDIIVVMDKMVNDFTGIGKVKEEYPKGKAS